MHNLLILHSSGRVNRSITRQLASQFRQQWQDAFADAHILERDLVASPCSLVDEPWIAAAFTPDSEQTAFMRQRLEQSNTLVKELMAADHVVIGAPLYNFGMPAALKAYFDQIVRVGKTFAFDPAQPEPYTPLLGQTPVTVIISAGDGALLPGGPLYHLNSLEPHLKTLAGFIGLAEPDFVRVGYDEYQDDRHLDSKERAAKALSDHVRTVVARRRSQAGMLEKVVG
ncbi:FMN-dependent NADH-azoreductase [Gilvimarinus algae]|uniref:FMN dependent NADH:quinone oxidoreductase n=1 Tax=Gilvimarinus algae TaxID=3058037 RepID=A0ABT8TGE6_9GAMM|nr:NAD(P)H-dependent oxidoreductase [Gilvimarinus sp. SDUM040014]MDO3383162.1 NAD(P)H-dependent oxidoreductase [Gilvimarinus sp. SDUM040014]